MKYVLTHASALEAMRLERFCAAPRRKTDATRPPSLKGCSQADVERWLESSPLLRGLARPVQLLVPACAEARRTPVFDARPATSEYPPGSFVSLGGDGENDGGAGIVAPELCLLQMAREATCVELALLACELFGLYAIQPDSELGMIQREEPLCTPADALGLMDAVPRAPGAARLREALGLAFTRSGSPMESKLSCRIGWSRPRGGYGLQILELNQSLELQKIERDLKRRQIRMPDIVLSLPSEGRQGICVDYHGEVHEEEGRRQIDDARTNELVASGIRPFTVWHAQYQSMRFMDGLVDGVIRMGLGLPDRKLSFARREVERARREALLAELNAIDGLSWGASESDPYVLKAKDDVEYALAQERAIRKRNRERRAA